uniref:Uncharacterized protein n=1 Tax=Solanum tuberosum TaxID=4113 RepID=M1BV43_SOLTU
MVHHRLDKLMYLMRISIKKEKIMINYTCKRKLTNSAAADGYDGFLFLLLILLAYLFYSCTNMGCGVVMRLFTS